MKANQKNVKSIKKIARLVSATCVALAIYGCSSIEEDPDAEQPMTPEQQQQYMLEKIESWSAAEPDIQRILELESDMQLIINQLASMAELDDDPLESESGLNTQNSDSTAGVALNASISNVNAESNNVESNNVEETKSIDSINNQASTNSSANMNNNVNTSSRSMGHYFPKIGLHIGMFNSVDSVPLGWKYLQSILPRDLINKKPLVSKVNYENTEYYSLRVGPFRSANSAKTMCVNLQQQQHYCSVVEYKGFSLISNGK
jgi:hypothetical protein